MIGISSHRGWLWMFAGMVVLLIATHLLGDATRAHAAEEDEETKCGFCLNYLEPDEHQFIAGICWPATGEGCKDCKAFNARHTNRQPGTCGANHWACGNSNASIERLERSLTEPEPEESLRALVASDANGVEFTTDGYVVVLGCDAKTVVHAVRLPADLAKVFPGGEPLTVVSD